MNKDWTRNILIVSIIVFQYRFPYLIRATLFVELSTKKDKRDVGKYPIKYNCLFLVSLIKKLCESSDCNIKLTYREINIIEANSRAARKKTFCFKTIYESVFLRALMYSIFFHPNTIHNQR